MPMKYIYETGKRWKDFTPVPSLWPTLFAPSKNFHNSLTHSQCTYPCLRFCTLSRLIRPDKNLRKKLLRKEWVKEKYGWPEDEREMFNWFLSCAYIILKHTRFIVFPFSLLQFTDFPLCFSLFLLFESDQYKIVFSHKSKILQKKKT